METLLYISVHDVTYAASLCAPTMHVECELMCDDFENANSSCSSSWGKDQDCNTPWARRSDAEVAYNIWFRSGVSCGLCGEFADASMGLALSLWLCASLCGVPGKFFNGEYYIRKLLYIKRVVHGGLWFGRYMSMCSGATVVLAIESRMFCIPLVSSSWEWLWCCCLEEHVTVPMIRNIYLQGCI
jgi:hypothetical protein